MAWNSTNEICVSYSLSNQHDIGEMVYFDNKDRSLRTNWKFRGTVHKLYMFGLNWTRAPKSIFICWKYLWCPELNHGPDMRLVSYDSRTKIKMNVSTVFNLTPSTNFILLVTIKLELVPIVFEFGIFEKFQQLRSTLILSLKKFSINQSKRFNIRQFDGDS